MPKVNGKSFSYTPAGRKAAKAAKDKKAKPPAPKKKK